jgi:hypothetical protein
MTDLTDPSGQPIIPVGDAFELIAVVECFNTKWADSGAALPLLEGGMVSLGELARDPNALKAYLSGERGAALRGFGPDQPHVTPIDGGCLLTSALCDSLSPSCCGDFDDITVSWTEMAALETEEWVEIRTGHPGLLARRSGASILVADCHEPDTPRIPEHPILELSAASLKAKVAAVMRELEAAAPALTEALAGLVDATPYRPAAARALLGLSVDTTGWWPE